MREKKWINCPSCGAKESMQKMSNRKERFNPSGYPPLDVSDLEGQFCKLCGEGFWSLDSEKRISSLLAEHMAEEDAKRVVAAELVSVKYAAKEMEITQQAVHKMMREGRLRYVTAGGSRLPIGKFLKKRTKATKLSSA